LIEKVNNNNSNSKNDDLDSLRFNWCLFRNDVLYFGNYDHPGGNRFFEKVRGREVSRFIYGVQGIESDPHFDIVHTHKTVFINALWFFKVGEIR
jgi:hypothetical protein